MQRLFESKTNQAVGAGLPNNVDANIILDSAPHILYYQFDLDDNFRTYLEGAMISENSLRTGLQKIPLQQSYEMTAGSQSRSVTFNNAFKQFSFIEISLVYDRSDQHLSIYDSYNAEVAATQIKSIKLQNASNTYSEFNRVKFDLEDQEDQYTLYNALTVWVTEGLSIAPQRDYAYNQICQKLPNRTDYFTDSDERVYIDIRLSKGYTGEFERVNRDDTDLTITVDLKAAAVKKMMLPVTRYFQGEYMYMLGKEGLIVNYKEYGVNKQKSVTQ